MEHEIDSLRAIKDKEHHNIFVCNDLARQYRTKADELEEKHQQLTQLHSEFETKVQQKEVCFLFLKQNNHNTYLDGRKSN
jgi:gluconate kinase